MKKENSASLHLGEGTGGNVEWVEYAAMVPGNREGEYGGDNNHRRRGP